VDGFVKGSGLSFAVNAADYSLGGHTLQVTVEDSAGKYWSKTLQFTVTAPVTAVSLNKSALDLPVTGTETLLASVSPANAANKTITWTSSDTAIAAVNATTGLVSAIAPGTALIRAASAENTALYAECTVAVTAGGSQGITLSFDDPGSGTFTGTSFTVVKSGSPPSETIALTGTWTSQEWRVDGFVKGSGSSFTVNAADYSVGGHTLQVTVEDSAGKYWSKTLQFTVTAAVTAVSLNKSAVSLLLEGTETLFASVIPANAANKTVTWTSDNTSVATVSSTGVVTAKALGTAVIKVESGENSSFHAECTVTVGAAQGITLSFDDPGSGTFTGTPFTVVKSGSPPSETITLTGTWTSQEWRVDGFVKGSGPSFTVNAADYSLGGHTLQVTVEDSAGKYWSKTLQFTVAAN
jgi:uncharacterized protein YjdB